ncbi:flavodoxin reductase [Pseudoflavitalea sp. X16]|uniref:FAD-binding oxidoreductase n=1 Tax=Paraflavitalea devenefica TaxID=2716334 RepID=UPI001423F15A|nr:FAD-binding oxidoreductase [Paraflavitalea devenefica]NII25432.1 flavodoxin reductase [Paraflavitalea devenefica]
MSAEEHIVKILAAEFVTHNVRRFTLEKPVGYRFEPGQATEISINKPDWKNERRPFTFTSLNEWEHLEFTIKIYSDRQGVTNELGKLQPDDELILHDVWGTIHYEGPGTFIAGGAGVTPFIAILRQLYNTGKLGNNQLIFSNRTEKDIILKEEFTAMLGDRFINTLTQEKTTQYDNHKIDAAYLQEVVKDFNQYFYICGPDAMVDELEQTLIGLGVPKEKVVREQF